MYAYGKSKIYWDTKENHAHDKFNIKTANEVNSSEFLRYFILLKRRVEDTYYITETLFMSKDYTNKI